MKKTSYLLAAMALATGAYAQPSTVAAKYAKLISVEDARKHLSILASDDFEGRETGKAGATKAANYLAGEFKKLGLQAPVNGSYFFNVPLTEKNFQVTDFTLNGQKIADSEYFTTGDYTDKKITAEDVVFVGYGTDTELGTASLADKVVVWINEDRPAAGTTPNTGLRPSAARGAIIGKIMSQKPAVLLAVNPETATILAQYGASIKGSQLTLKKEVAAPAGRPSALFFVTPVAADQLLKGSGQTYSQFKEAAAAGTVPAKTIKATTSIAYQTTTKDVTAQDVLGYLPGSDPKLKNEVLVFSAHYDHIGLNATGPDKVNNGADDDGSGTTAVLELAHAFTQAKKDGHGPKRSILFLGNVGEEKGLLGSEYYTDHPIYPLQNTITDLNIDMIGRIDDEYIKHPDSANYVYVVGSDKISTELRKISESVNAGTTKLKLDYKYDDPNDPEQIYYRSDHYNFAKHGVPIAFYTSGLHKQYHQPNDEVRFINFPALVKRAQLVFYTGWELANRDQRPVVDVKQPAAPAQ